MHNSKMSSYCGAEYVTKCSQNQIASCKDRYLQIRTYLSLPELF